MSPSRHDNSSASAAPAAPAALPARVEPGDVIANFKIVAPVGRGGMGAVYKAIDQTLGRTVALKMLSADLAGASDAAGVLARFRQEAQSAAQVSHENVVQIFSFGVDRNIPYIAMELLKGENLAARIGRAGLSASETADIALPVCSGIHAAHRRGILHRDLKPANIFLARGITGEIVKILDFGISKLGKESESEKLTATGAIIGTAHYMAPEQAIAERVDFRADQYSLGVVLYECVTRRPPHEGKNFYQVVRDASTGVYPRPREFAPDLPPAFENLIVKAMSADPEQRYADMRELGRALLPFASPRARSQWTEYYEVAPPDLRASGMNLTGGEVRAPSTTDEVRQFPGGGGPNTGATIANAMLDPSHAPTAFGAEPTPAPPAVPFAPAPSAAAAPAAPALAARPDATQILDDLRGSRRMTTPLRPDPDEPGLTRTRLPTPPPGVAMPASTSAEMAAKLTTPRTPRPGRTVALALGLTAAMGALLWWVVREPAPADAGAAATTEVAPPGSITPAAAAPTPAPSAPAAPAAPPAPAAEAPIAPVAPATVAPVNNPVPSTIPPARPTRRRAGGSESARTKPATSPADKPAKPAKPAKNGVYFTPEGVPVI